MIANPYREKLDKLVSGEIKELKIDKNEFMGYRNAWYTHPEKEHIVGEALFNGGVIYRYQKDVEGL
jgi:hypothetical protein